MAQIKVEYWPLDRLKKYPNNPKRHPDEQITALRASIRDMGFVQPILVDREDEIIAGHGRLEAARLERMDKVPVIKLKDLTEAQVLALRIADNSIPQQGEWIPEALQGELEKLGEMDFDLTPYGLDTIELPELEPLVEERPTRQRSKTTIFLSVKNADAAKAKRAVITALNKAKIEHNL